MERKDDKPEDSVIRRLDRVIERGGDIRGIIMKAAIAIGIAVLLLVGTLWLFKMTS